MLGIIDKPSISTLGVVRESIPMPEPEAMAEPVVAPAEPEAPQNPKDWWTGKKQEYKKPQDMKIALFGGQHAKGFNEANPKYMGNVDAKPRFEIDDSNAKIDPIRSTTPGNYTLDQLLHHSELFFRYPYLKKLPIKITPPGSENYSDAKNKGAIIMSSKPPTESTGSLGVLLHEIQHAIQLKEGFAYSTPSSETAYNKTGNEGVFPGEQEAAAVEDRRLMDRNERSAHPPTDIYTTGFGPQPRGETYHA